MFDHCVNVFFFWFMRALDLDSQYWSGQIQNIESLKRLYSVRWGGNKWPWRPLGVNYGKRLAATVWKLAWWFFCWRGSWTAWQSALGGDGVDGHHYWWLCGLSQRIWVIFLQKRRKILGSKNLHVFQCQIFAVAVSMFCSSIVIYLVLEKKLHVCCFRCNLIYYSCKLRPQLVTLGSLVITKFHKLKVASFTDISSHLCRPGINFINILRQQLKAVANKLVHFENTAQNHPCKGWSSLLCNCLKLRA